MKITARISREDKDLVNILTKRNIVAKSVRGGVIVELPQSDSNIPEFEIPEEVNGAILLIDVTEYGGGATNTGDSVVVCGTQGEPLRPYYVPRSGHLSCETHAHFAVREEVVTIAGAKPGTRVEIQKHRIVRNGNIARIKSEKIGSGDLEDIPEILGHFQDAAEATVEKANCYHCRCVHYATR